MGSGTAMDINQTLFMVELVIANNMHNISNITSNAKGWQTVMYVVIGQINPQGLIWMVATHFTDIHFVLVFLANKKYLSIEGIIILLCLSIWSIIPSAGRNQMSNISFGMTHQSWILKVVNYQDLVIHMVKTNLF